MINIPPNSDFDAISNEGLLVQIFQVDPKLVGASEAPTNVTKMGQAAES